MKVKSFLKKYKDACEEARVWMRKNNIQTMEEAWKGCERSDWMTWVLRKLNCADKMTWVKIALACTKRSLSIYEKRGNSDAPRKAIEAWIKDPTEENRMKCQIVADASTVADAASAAVADAAYAAAGAAYAIATTDAAYVAYAAGAAAYAAYADAERKAQCKIIRHLVKNPFI